MILQGTHGTTKANAASIQSKGFRKTVGRSGTGAYLWVVDDGHYAVPLAIAWARSTIGSPSRKSQKDQLDQVIAVIHCSISLNRDEEFLDLEAQSMKAMLTEVALKLGLLQSERKEDLCKCVDFLVDRISKKTGVPIVVLQARVAPPPKEYFGKEKYPMKLIGAPLSYIVRSPSHIQVVRVDEVME